jgi:hypothetical protein
VAGGYVLQMVLHRMLMKKSGKKEKNEEQPPFHYRGRSFRLADETYDGFVEAFKASGKRSWNLFFVEINKRLSKNKDARN